MDDDVRRELDLLHQTDRDLRQAIADLDNHGSRGVLQLTGQVTDLIKDVAEVKAALTTHDGLHTTEKRDARNTRRWTIGTLIATGALSVAIVSMLIDIMRRLH